MQEILDFLYFYLDKWKNYRYNRFCQLSLLTQPGEVAQLARAFGSYPKGHVFESHLRYQIYINNKNEMFQSFFEHLIFLT